MIRYRYKAKNNEGKTIHGVFYVDSEQELRDLLVNQGYYLVKAKKVKDTAEFFSDFQKIKMDDLTNFARQFGIMLKSGISISKSLETLKVTVQNKQLQKILEGVYMDVLSGVPLSTAFSKYPKTFPLFFCNMTNIGEMSGSLDYVMVKLADYYEKDTKTKRKAKSALAYPTFLICLVFAVLLILSVFVMPMFDNLFASFDAELPGITKAVIAVSTFIKKYILHIILIILLLIFGIVGFKKTKKGRLIFDNFKISAPVLGKINKAVITSRFSSGFSTLLQSGIPLVNAIDTMGKLLGNKAVEQKFEVCKTQLRRGQKVAKSIATVGIFPDMLIEMVSVGENTGQLETVLDTTSSFFEDQVDREIKKATSILEPAMIIFIAGIVCIVLLSVFLPMMGLMDAIEGSAGA